VAGEVSLAASGDLEGPDAADGGGGAVKRGKKKRVEVSQKKRAKGVEGMKGGTNEQTVPVWRVQSAMEYQTSLAHSGEESGREREGQLELQSRAKRH
jgi:hypothetical protein